MKECKNVLVKVTVNNSGLDFEDDVDLAFITCPIHVENYQVQNALVKADKQLREENEEGDCAYNEEGWNIKTLLDSVCKAHNWTWSRLVPKVDFTIG